MQVFQFDRPLFISQTALNDLNDAPEIKSIRSVLYDCLYEHMSGGNIKADIIRRKNESETKIVYELYYRIDSIEYAVFTFVENSDPDVVFTPLLKVTIKDVRFIVT